MIKTLKLRLEYIRWASSKLTKSDIMFVFCYLWIIGFVISMFLAPVAALKYLLVSLIIIFLLAMSSLLKDLCGNIKENWHQFLEIKNEEAEQIADKLKGSE